MPMLTTTGDKCATERQRIAIRPIRYAAAAAAESLVLSPPPLPPTTTQLTTTRTAQISIHSIRITFIQSGVMTLRARACPCHVIAASRRNVRQHKRQYTQPHTVRAAYVWHMMGATTRTIACRHQHSSAGAGAERRERRK